MAFKEIIVAVHGIGSQSRFSTVRSVATQLAGSQALSDNGKVRPVAPQPLGYFHSDVKSATAVRWVDDVEGLKGCDLEAVGFSEVFWADIPQQVVAEGRTLEETKAWARTVVARAQALCERAQKDSARNGIVPPDFSLAGEVLDEIIETVYVLENLSMIAEKAGFFKFDLRKILEEYLGDVQLVAEFSYYRLEIVSRFHEAMRSIHAQHPEARLHIVAHSEGTVVTLLGLLHALCGRKLHPADPQEGKGAQIEQTTQAPGWIKRVHGLMTIGSPLDKHVLLWPRLWSTFNVPLAKQALPAGQIRWRNYYDFGDPVGFKLDSTRLWLAQQKIEAFEFCGCKNCRHDVGFARYLLPGAAHNEYWNDAEIFEHFITNVVKMPSVPEPANPSASPPKPAPGSKRRIAILSPVLPYLFSFLVLMLGGFVLFKAVYAYAHPSLDALQKFVRFQELGVYPPEGLHGWRLLSAVFGVTALIAGATLLARFPRLAVGKRWLGAGFLALLVGCGLYVVAVDLPVRNDIGDFFWYMYRWFGAAAPTLGILGLTAIAGMSGYLATFQKLENRDRRQRWILRGTRPLLICGAIAIGLVVISQLYPRNITGLWEKNGKKAVSFSPAETDLIKRVGLTPDELWQLTTNNPTGWTAAVQKVEPLIKPAPSIWPVVLAGAAFLYLWWLAMLLFDLSFVWHRYIRRSTTNDRLREWNPYGFSPRWSESEAEPCCKKNAPTLAK